MGGENIETVTPGEMNPFNETQFRITNEGSNQTNSDSTGMYSNNQIMLHLDSRVRILVGVS